MSQWNDQLRYERIRHHWRQQDLADQLGTSVVTVQRWERGSHHPSAYFRLKLCALFDKSAEALGLVQREPGAITVAAQDPFAGGSLSVYSSKEHRLWTVPSARNPHFTGRDDLLHQLDQHFSSLRPGDPTTARRAALTQPQAIKGLGGIGKTQIAIEYAYRSREQGHYAHTLWINAANEEALVASFVALAELLPDFSETNESDQRKRVAAIKRWLEHCPQRWLLIFDNADDLSLLQEYLPQQGQGSILLTTRAHAVGSVATSVEVGTMGFLEGTQLLLHRAQRLARASEEEMHEAGNVVVALDHFPLALDQAGAYIEETGCRCSDYLQIYQDHRRALLARRGTQATAYPDSVATTWSLSFHRIEATNPAAAELLRVCAYLSPDRIPEELLTRGASHWPAVLQQATTDLLAFNQMLEEVLSFSLVTRQVEDHLLSMHRLVQAVQVDALTPEEQRQWAERVVRAVHAVFPREVEGQVAIWPQCLRYLEQAQACDTLIQQHHLVLPEAAELLDRAGTYLQTHASYTLAEPLYRRALHIYERLLGPEHVDVATPLQHVAQICSDQGKYTEAEPLYQRALHIREQQLGPEHPLVASSLHGLAALYEKQGKYTEAELLYQRALHIREQQLGPEHPKVASSLNNLANLYAEQGKYAEAEPLIQRALHIREQQLGPEHPEVASSLNNLAILYYSQGKYTEAEPLFQRAVHIQEQQLGPEHPLVARPLNGLAILYYLQGKYAEAEPLLQRAVHIQEQQLGPEHPEVPISLNGLAILYYLQGKYAEAKPLLQRALHIQEQQVGPEHPKVACILNNLAELYYLQGKYVEAEPLFQRALHIQEQQVGPERTGMATLLNNLAELYYLQGKYVEAEPLFQRALHIFEQQLGSEHPQVAHPLNGLANLYRQQGKYGEAEPLYQRELSIREQRLGPEHPETAQTIHDLAAFQQMQGNCQEALSLYERALAIREQALGPAHPKTRATHQCLAALRQSVSQEGVAPSRDDISPE